MDKPTDNGICFESTDMLRFFCGVMSLDESNKELLNSVYKEINEEFGIDVAMRIYQIYKGTQVNFPMRFFNPEMVKQRITKEYDGTNLKQLAVKYGYSEKTIRRMIKENLEGRWTSWT